MDQGVVPAASRTPEAIQEVNLLENNVKALEELVNEIHARTDHIIAPPTTPPQAPKGGPTPSSAFALRIFKVNQTLANAFDALQDWKKRLEV